MHKFFEDYYVASNMALILSGDFDAQQVMPILEKAFSRIRSGNAPKQEKVMLPAFNGRETMKESSRSPLLRRWGLVSGVFRQPRGPGSLEYCGQLVE